MSKRKSDDTVANGSSKKSKGKSVLDMIVDAIRHEKNHLGSSRQSIIKNLKELYQYENENAIKKSLKVGIQNSRLLCENKTRFKVKGDPEYEVPASEKVEVEVIHDPKEEEHRGMICEKGDIVQIDYIGYLNLDGGSTKKRFETGSKFEFMVGAGDVIKGLDKGVLGAKLGEVRQVYIPSQLGYGKKGSGPDLPPDSDLIFKITVVSIGKS